MSDCETCDIVGQNLKKALETQKKVKSPDIEYYSREHFHMALSSTTKQVATSYVGGLVGKGISYGLAMYDAGKGVTLAAPVYKSAFFVGNLAVSVLSAVAAVHYGRRGKLSATTFGALVGAGTVATSELVDVLEKTIGGRRLTYAPQPQFQRAPVAARYNLSGVDTVIPTGKAGTYRGLT